MLAKTYGAALQSLDAIPVTIEVLTSPGTQIIIVGLPDTAVKESIQRVSAAIEQSGMVYPMTHTVVNMSPADVRKEGAAYDLPISLGLLGATNQVDTGQFADSIIMGELSLDGNVLPIKGVLPMAIMARARGFRRFFVPAENAREAAVVNNLEVYGVQTLWQAVEHFNGRQPLAPTVVDTRSEFAGASACFPFDFADVKGQESVKRAFEVACAGGHNLLMVGPPGSGKSMMAKRLPTILPPLTLAEALETTKIHSVAGKLKGGSTLMTMRPFRSPHHTISPVALVGGGSNPTPGEISLAHNGVLFLDEFPEFSRSVLEVMRQPLEDRHITIARAKYTIDYPAGFMLVASMNPCPCGYYNHPTRECTCTPQQVQRYLGRISGPLLDRIDLQVEIQPVEFGTLSEGASGETSAAIRARVVAARALQQQRYAADKGIHCNAQMTPALVARWVRPTPHARALLQKAMTKYNMSARAYDRILKVSRTIADLAGDASSELSWQYIGEAISYRSLDRPTWGFK